MAVDADQDWTLLDREKLDIHQVTIEVVDGGGKRSSVRLDVNLLDVNDQSPEIVRSQYESYVRENEATLERAVVVEVRHLLITRWRAYINTVHRGIECQQKYNT